MSTFDFQNGQLLLIDKPLNWTSFDVVNKIRYQIKPVKKVGHAGTLDPLATGLLILMTGRGTKKIPEYQGLDKEYTGIITLGATTPSYDLETETDQHFPYEHLSEAEILAAAKQLTGTIEQLPPAFSAIKGKRMYELARKGKTVERKARTVHIHTFEITKIELPNVHFRINCSKGTYIRSIAHDIGQLLNNGGHLSSLRRTKIGDHHIDNAWQLDELVTAIGEWKSEQEIGK